MTTALTFTFQPRWKEELWCECELGRIVLDMPMGVPSVNLPTRQEWQERAPAWARPLWETFIAQLEAWCDGRIPTYPGMGSVYFEPRG